MLLYENYYDQSFSKILIKIKILYSTIINIKANIHKYKESEI